MDSIDQAIAASAERAFTVLERLVAEPSTIGNEAGAQEVLASELDAAGFSIARPGITDDIADDAASGVPPLSYEGRFNVVAQRGPADAHRTLVINGHMDVVPAEDTSQWTSDPFLPVRKDGWLVGRGAGDMKAGFAAGLLAIWALDRAVPGWLTGGLTFVSCIEEEATGNGTLAAGRAGYVADAALLLEPTDLEILLGGIALVWVSVEIKGRAGHAEAAGESVNPILAVGPIIDGLRRLEHSMNLDHTSGVDADPAFIDIPHPYNVNIGKVRSGDWPSSVPAVARVDVRIGHPRHWTSEQTLEHARLAILESVAGDEWFQRHPPTVVLSGYRAERYFQDPDSDLVRAFAAAHQSVHDAEPGLVTIGSTTDARFYLNQFGMPAIAYGPRARNIHGTDEAVELASIVECARTVARFLLEWFSPGAPR